MKSKQLIAMSLIAIFALGVTGCKKNTSTTGETKTPVNSVETAAPANEESGNPFETIIATYDKSIGFVEVSGHAKTEEEQKSALAAMKKLKLSGATSTELFSYFKENIEGLRAPYSDDFTAYAISGIQKNSFEDYDPNGVLL